MIYLALALALAGSSGAAAAEPAPGPEGGRAGRICVAALPKHAAEIDREYRGRKPRRQYTYRFAVKVDSQDWVDLPKEDPLPIEGIPVDGTHTLQIRDGDRVIESFTFTFEEKRGLDLCLRYTPWYQTWQLDPPSPRAWWCKCGGAAG
jgi:hypothetical protein